MRDKIKRDFNKMIKSYKKELNVINKYAMPYDYAFGVDYFITFLRFMLAYNKHDYRDRFENQDPTRAKKIEKMQEALDIYNQIENCEGKYFKLVEVTKDNNKYSGNFDCLLPNKNENMKAYEKEYKQLKNKFLKIIIDHIEEWWD